MIKIEYDFRKDYDPTTSITNELTAGTTYNPVADLVVENKKFIDVAATICTIGSSGILNVTFKNCLFVNCTKIFYSNSFNFGTLKFEKCTIYNCETIVDTGTATGAITIEYSILWKSPFMNTAINITFTNGKPSAYQPFVGYTGSLTTNDSIQSYPMWISLDTDDLPGENPDGLGFVLMSISRGYDYDSPCLIGDGTNDMGCWIEARDTDPEDTYSSRIFSYLPGQSKDIELVGLNSFRDVNGVARSTHDSEKESISLSWSENGMDDDDVDAIVAILSSNDNQILIYPDSEDDERYLGCRVNKDKSTQIKKQSGRYWDAGDIDNMLFDGLTINATIEEKVGTW